jgi:hydroxymethylpyrimidine/phosphomethylpyrimidine kinase
MTTPPPPPCVLTIAGSDSGGGAGIQADLKTIAAHRCYGASVLAALTAQNTRGVTAVHDVPPAFVRDQLHAVLTDLDCRAAKTGMLSQAAVIAEVAAALATFAVPNLVVDPVMISKSGHRLLSEDAIAAMRERLIPMARVVTPNAHEAGALLGREVASVADARGAAVALGRLGCRAVLVKGGHLEDGDHAVDILWDAARGLREISGPRLSAAHTHGTGCSLSAAIASNLALGWSLDDAVARAKNWLAEAMRAGYPVGGGISPVNHLHAFGPPERPGA